MAFQLDFDLDVTYSNNDIPENLLALVPNIRTKINEKYAINNAYWQINRIEGDKAKLNFTVAVYTNSNKEVLLATKQYSFVPSDSEDAERWDKQAYRYMKEELPEFAYAIDVLEDGQVA